MAIVISHRYARLLCIIFILCFILLYSLSRSVVYNFKIIRKYSCRLPVLFLSKYLDPRFSLWHINGLTRYLPRVGFSRQHNLLRLNNLLLRYGNT